MKISSHETTHKIAHKIIRQKPKETNQGYDSEMKYLVKKNQYLNTFTKSKKENTFPVYLISTNE